MQIIREHSLSNLEGTIIDLETIGEFSKKFKDSRYYSRITPVFFGFINNKGIEIHCAENEQEIKKLHSVMNDLLDKLPRPFYSFNAPFEMGTIFHSLDKQIFFDRELNGRMFEAKSEAVKKLEISNYDDPFFDVGKKFPFAWKEGKLPECIAHNRADLLKERDILNMRGFRKPDELKFVSS